MATPYSSLTDSSLSLPAAIFSEAEIGFILSANTSADVELRRLFVGDDIAASVLRSGRASLFARGFETEVGDGPTLLDGPARLIGAAFGAANRWLHVAALDDEGVVSATLLLGPAEPVVIASGPRSTLGLISVPPETDPAVLLADLAGSFLEPRSSAPTDPSAGIESRRPADSTAAVFTVRDSDGPEGRRLHVWAEGAVVHVGVAEPGDLDPETATACPPGGLLDVINDFLADPAHGGVPAPGETGWERFNRD